MVALRDEAAELLDAVCEDDDDWDAAEAAAIDVISTAYDEYFETLEDLGCTRNRSASARSLWLLAVGTTPHTVGRTVVTTFVTATYLACTADSLSRGHRRCRRCRSIGCRLRPDQAVMSPIPLALVPDRGTFGQPDEPRKRRERRGQRE